MVNVGERWKFATAQVDFTIVSLDDEFAYYKMNWSEHQRQVWLNNPVVYYVYDGWGRARAIWRYHNPDKICKVQLSSFVNGKVVRSD
ncbi:hypothetical protein SEA_SHAM_245 [Streptomyces phage Sham]|nr:hypothetical protein SEA_SHAM_245 [Streptomyces phage Sham]